MDSQVFLWASLVIPWLSLIFLKQKELRRYMPVALFSVFSVTIITEAGTSFHWWATTETLYPLINIPVYTYGAYFIGTIWIFTYTFHSFWLYLTTNLVIDSILAFFLVPWMTQMGIMELYISSFQGLLLTIAVACLLYGFQLWQEGATVLETTPSVQPAASKPLHEDPKDKNGN